MIVGIMGCGSIAGIITDFYINNKLNVDIKYFYDYKKENADLLAKKAKAQSVNTLTELIKNSDLVVESASQNAVKENAPKILETGTDMIIMSVGSLLDTEFYNKLDEIAKKSGAHIYLPSGAVTGIDTIKAVPAGGIEEISLLTSKPPESLDVEITNGKPVTLFEGNASKAVKLYPKNINVSSILSLASGIDINVKIIADPSITRNTHEIHVKGTFGELITKTANESCENNPKTSALAAYSAISLLNNLNTTIRLGS